MRARRGGGQGHGEGEAGRPAARAVKVDEHPLALGVSAAAEAELPDVVHGGVQLQLVARARLPALVLGLEGLADGVESLLRLHAAGLYPALGAGARGHLREPGGKTTGF